MRQTCACNEMDYECDIGYYKTDEGVCLKLESNEEPETTYKNGLTE